MRRHAEQCEGVGDVRVWLCGWCVGGVRVWSNLLPTLYGNKAGELGDYGVLSTGVDDVILTLSLDKLNNQVHSYACQPS